MKEKRLAISGIALVLFYAVTGYFIGVEHIKVKETILITMSLIS